MPLNRSIAPIAAAFLGLLSVRAACACDLQVESGWIRAAPPGASTLAAYAMLKNTGVNAVAIATITTDAAEMAMLHETTVTNGISEMRMLPSLRIAGGATLTLAPGGKHLMLTGLKGLPKVGEHVKIAFTDESGCVTQGDFGVRSMMSD
jgi:copper(I)-binding protein